MGPRIYRPDKLNNVQTLEYEIKMLRDSARKLEEGIKNDVERWVHLECFLLHFRNLIEFFSGRKSREGTLTIRKPERIWENRPVPPKEELGAITRLDLWEKYEPEGDEPARISQYLQHCTEKRLEFKDWDVGEMYNDIKPVLEKFESLVSDCPKVTRLMEPFSVSTASASQFQTFDNPSFSPERAINKSKKKN